VGVINVSVTADAWIVNVVVVSKRFLITRVRGE